MSDELLDADERVAELKRAIEAVVLVALDPVPAHERMDPLPSHAIPFGCLADAQPTMYDGVDDDPIPVRLRHAPSSRLSPMSRHIGDVVDVPTHVSPMS